MKKRAIIYVRVSTDEQANHGYSLRDQEERLRKYCDLNSIENVKLYREDHSAKDFNRPEFKKLMQFVKSHRKSIDLLLVVKWDRFSRNIAESYAVIKNLSKLGIEVQAIEQPLDLDIPENKIMLAFYLSAPEVENDRRSINTINGMRRARKEGRWICTAPKGYKNLRDEHNKPIIVPDENAKFIKSAFEQVATELKPVDQIRKELNKKGFVCSKSNFARLLRNPVYMGKVKVGAYKKEQEQLVDGIHRALIPEVLFYKVQQVMDHGRTKRNKPYLHTTNPKLPLRGFLFCPVCENKITGSGSRGNGGRYFYYHCNHCGETRTRAEVVEKQIMELLQSLKIRPENVSFIKKAFSEFIKESIIQDKINRVDIHNKINKLKTRIAYLQDRFADGSIPVEDYLEMKSRYQEEMSGLEEKELETGSKERDLDIMINRALNLMQRFDKLYIEGDIEVKERLLSSIFTGKIYISENGVRTTRINQAVTQIHSIDGAFERNKKGQPAEKMRLSFEVAPAGIEPTFKV